MKQKGALSKTDHAKLTEIIGHSFGNKAGLERALTHSSARRDGRANYERLEFLGDRVLGLVVAELLFSLFPMAKEGELSARMNQLVSAETCAKVADELALHRFIQTGADIKMLTGQRMSNVRADVVEALIAAIYLDAGLEAARTFILRNWNTRARASADARRDAKTELQEWAHGRTCEAPSYTIVERTGPDHDPLFTVRVEISGYRQETGNGRSRRAAEQAAATRLLEREGIWNTS